jgi:indole-3-glycerol phosphate synthase
MMPAAIINKIVRDRKKDVERRKKMVPLALVKEKLALRKRPLELTSTIKSEKIRLIAEVKKASPSKGVLCQDFRPLQMAKLFAQNGAAAISVLTEARYFMGDILYLEIIKKEVNVPVLRKDFIFDEFQVYESAAYGADALLLITAILSQSQLERLVGLSHDLGMQCLVEVHNEKELERALRCDSDVIGINNRDLNTFHVNMETTRRLCEIIPAEKIVVSESGIKKRSELVKFQKWGVNAVLVGEALVTAKDIPTRIKELLP